MTSPVDDRALWLWRRLLDFDRLHILEADPAALFDSMLDHMAQLAHPTGQEADRPQVVGEAPRPHRHCGRVWRVLADPGHLVLARLRAER
ncbi:MAG: hypothetical protein ACJ8AW_13070 [Rhodopila sp.]